MAIHSADSTASSTIRRVIARLTHGNAFQDFDYDRVTVRVCFELQQLSAFEAFGLDYGCHTVAVISSLLRVFSRLLSRLTFSFASSVSSDLKCGCPY
jgi:hypothetical protein